MKLLLTTAGFVFLALLFSCQKEIDAGVQPKVLNDSTTLVKYFELDTTLPAGVDTMRLVLIDYDAQGRPAHVVYHIKDQSLPPSAVFPYYDSVTYFYNGSDTLPYKVNKSEKSFLVIERDTIYIFYSAGKVIRDSIRSRYINLLPPPTPDTESITVNTYTDNGNTAQVNMLQAYSLTPSAWPPPCPATTLYQKTYINGNISYQFGDYTNTCGGIGTSESSHLDFDNHPNPFYKFSVPYPVSDDFLGNGYRNNITLFWEVTPADGYRFTYTYRNDGYPLIVRFYDVADPAVITKGTYVYK